MNRLTAAGIPGIAGLMLLLGSCSTSSFMGLSRSSHVETRLDEMQAEITRLHGMEDELEEALENEDRLLVAVEELRRITDGFSLELDAVAGEIRSELEGIPEETLRDLISAIESYLEEGPEGDSPAPAALPPVSPEPESGTESGESDSTGTPEPT